MRVTLICRKTGDREGYDEVTEIEETKNGVMILKNDGFRLLAYLSRDYLTIIGDDYSLHRVIREAKK